MLSDKERIETLLTALETALEIAKTLALVAPDDIETIEKTMNDLTTMEDYAKFEREKLNGNFIPF